MHSFSKFVCVISCFSLVGGPCFAQNPPAVSGSSASETPVVRNVRLGEGGTVTGLVVDGFGEPSAEATLVLRSDDTETTLKSDADGVLRISGVRPGLATVSVGGNVYACRFWPSRIAPPDSIDTVVVVNQAAQFARGNDPGCDRPLAPAAKSKLAFLKPNSGFLQPLTATQARQLAALGLAAGVVGAAVWALTRDSSN